MRLRSYEQRFLSSIQKKLLLTACPSPGKDIFIDEAQDHYIFHYFYTTTRSAIGSIYIWLIMLVRIYLDCVA